MVVVLGGELKLVVKLGGVLQVRERWSLTCRGTREFWKLVVVVVVVVMMLVVVVGGGGWWWWWW